MRERDLLREGLLSQEARRNDGMHSWTSFSIQKVVGGFTLGNIGPEQTCHLISHFPMRPCEVARRLMAIIDPEHPAGQPRNDII